MFNRRLQFAWPALRLAAVALCSLLGAARAQERDNEEQARREQLQDMRRSAAQYILSSADTPQRVFKFHEMPALRFSNPVGGSKDGALYLWTDHGRPQAILKLYTFNTKNYTHAWLSLSENNFVAERSGKIIWSPTIPGIEVREIEGAPKPAETAAERLRQVGGLGACAPHLVVALVLEIDDEHVPGLRRRPRGGGAPGSGTRIAARRPRLASLSSIPCPG
jgi:hypothetical protein